MAKKGISVAIPAYALFFFTLVMVGRKDTQISAYLTEIMAAATFLPVISGILLFTAVKKRNRLLGEISLLLHSAFCLAMVFFLAETFPWVASFHSLQKGITWIYLYPFFLVPLLAVLLIALHLKVIRSLTR